ncbi:MAG: hypothetical protein ACLRWP_03870 [Bilophila wadsworthia]
MQFKLADVGGFRFLGMPDAVTHGLDGQSGVDRGRLGRLGRLRRHEQAAVLVEIRLMFKLIALLEVQAVAVRAFFKPRRAGKQDFPAAVSQPALAAGAYRQSSEIFPSKARRRFRSRNSGYPGIEMIPRQGRVEFAGPGEFLGGQAAFGKRFQPRIDAEMIHPAREDRPSAVRLSTTSAMRRSRDRTPSRKLISGSCQRSFRHFSALKASRRY